MIRNITWRRQVRQDVEQRLVAAHEDLARIAALLRDSAGVEVWTQRPQDEELLGAGMKTYDLEGWRTHFRAERARLAAFNEARGTALQAHDPALKAALDDYLTSIATLGAAFNQLINAALYRGPGGELLIRTVTQAHRDALAAAIEAELE